MPKIIQNIRRQLLDEAKRQITTHGYARTTIRSVASACGLGVGTVYNYFPSKDMLIASFMLEDWQACLAQMQGYVGNKKDVLRRVYDLLNAYMVSHNALFQDKDASKAFSASLAQRHKQLRSSLAQACAPVCINCEESKREFMSEFIAEALLTWCLAGKTFEEIYAIVGVLIE